MTTLMDLLAQTREESLHTPGRPQRSHEDHRRVLAAIQAHDAEAARRAMLDHLIAVERLVAGRDVGEPAVVHGRTSPAPSRPPDRRRPTR